MLECLSCVVTVNTDRDRATNRKATVMYSHAWHLGAAWHVPCDHQRRPHRRQRPPFLSNSKLQPPAAEGPGPSFSFPPPSKRKPKSECLCVVALSKQGQRFFSSVATSTAAGDTSATTRLIKKFVAASPKSVALDALSHLLSPVSSHRPHLSSLALPLYARVSESSWFEWNPTLVAQVAAFLDKQGKHDDATNLVSESISKLKLGFTERDLLLFYCSLVESHSKHNALPGFDDSFSRLNQLVRDSNSVYVKRQGFKSMIGGLCEMGRPGEADDLVRVMRGKGIKPSLFEYRCVLYGYGRLGLFESMHGCLFQMESEGLRVDTICANMILSSYGAHHALSDMVLWLQKMKTLDISFSARTYNSVLNSCPTIMSMMLGSEVFPTSLEELIVVLSEDEAMLVRELVGSAVFNEAMTCSASEAKLDLHGMHLGSAYLIMLQWIEEMRKLLSNKGKHAIPPEITVVCGSGNHSSVRGESPVKSMVKDFMFRTRSPLRVDRKNNGCFVAKGTAVKEWLC